MNALKGRYFQDDTTDCLRLAVSTAAERGVKETRLSSERLR